MYVPAPPVPVTNAVMRVPAVTPVPVIVAPTYAVPADTDESDRVVAVIDPMPVNDPAR